MNSLSSGGGIRTVVVSTRVGTVLPTAGTFPPQVPSRRQAWSLCHRQPIPEEPGSHTHTRGKAVQDLELPPVWEPHSHCPQWVELRMTHPPGQVEVPGCARPGALGGVLT